MIVLHAVTTPVSPETDLAGLHPRTTAAVSVLYEESDAEPEVNKDAVLEYGTRLSRLAQERPLLPMRYGTTTHSVAELDAVVHEHAAAWRRRLSKVEGHCEILVHLDVLLEDQETPAGSGTEFLLRRAADLHRQDSHKEELESVVSEWARDLRMLSDGRRLAALVQREHVVAVTEAVTEWAAGCGDVEVAVTGPWPPFSFCEEVGPS